MRRHADKIPEEWVSCPKCFRPYSFIRCRVSLRNPNRERCLECAVQEEKDSILKK